MTYQVKTNLVPAVQSLSQVIWKASKTKSGQTRRTNTKHILLFQTLIISSRRRVPGQCSTVTSSRMKTLTKSLINICRKKRKRKAKLKMMTTTRTTLSLNNWQIALVKTRTRQRRRMSSMRMMKMTITMIIWMTVSTSIPSHPNSPLSSISGYSPTSLIQASKELASIRISSSTKKLSSSLTLKISLRS